LFDGGVSWGFLSCIVFLDLLPIYMAGAGMEQMLGSKETNTMRKKRSVAKYYLLISLFSSTSLLVMQGSPIPYPTRHHDLQEGLHPPPQDPYIPNSFALPSKS